MATISTRDYLLDQAKRRFKPTPVTIPGMGALEKAAAPARMAGDHAGGAATGQ